MQDEEGASMQDGERASMQDGERARKRCKNCGVLWALLKTGCYDELCPLGCHSNERQLPNHLIRWTWNYPEAHLSPAPPNILRLKIENESASFSDIVETNLRVLSVDEVFLKLVLVVGPALPKDTAMDCFQLQSHFSELGLALEAKGVVTLMPNKDQRLALGVQKTKVRSARQADQLVCKTFVERYLTRLSEAKVPLIYNSFDLDDLALFEQEGAVPELRLTRVEASIAVLDSSQPQLLWLANACSLLVSILCFTLDNRSTPRSRDWLKTVLQVVEDSAGELDDSVVTTYLHMCASEALGQGAQERHWPCSEVLRRLQTYVQQSAVPVDSLLNNESALADKFEALAGGGWQELGQGTLFTRKNRYLAIKPQDQGPPEGDAARRAVAAAARSLPEVLLRVAAWAAKTGSAADEGRASHRSEEDAPDLHDWEEEDAPPGGRDTSAGDSAGHASVWAVRPIQATTVHERRMPPRGPSAGRSAFSSPAGQGPSDGPAPREAGGGGHAIPIQRPRAQRLQSPPPAAQGRVNWHTLSVGGTGRNTAFVQALRRNTQAGIVRAGGDTASVRAGTQAGFVRLGGDTASSSSRIVRPVPRRPDGKEQGTRIMHATPQWLGVPSQPWSSHDRQPSYAGNSHPAAGGRPQHTTGEAGPRYRHASGTVQPPSSVGQSPLLPQARTRAIQALPAQGQAEQGSPQAKQNKSTRKELKRKVVRQSLKSALSSVAGGGSYPRDKWQRMGVILRKIAQKVSPSEDVLAVIPKSIPKGNGKDRDSNRRDVERKLTIYMRNLLKTGELGSVTDSDAAGPSTQNDVWNDAVAWYNELFPVNPVPAANVSLDGRESNMLTSL